MDVLESRSPSQYDPAIVGERDGERDGFVIGMTLPNAHLAVVEQENVVAYLLNPTHPDNGGKATFFHMLGFEVGKWLDLATALRKLAIAGNLAKTVESPHGNKYVVEGRIESPSGRSPMVLSVWIVDRGLQAPRLVTAYPREDRE